MTDFIAIDWGTSSFRACRVSDNGEQLAKVNNNAGVASISADQQCAFLQQQIAWLSHGDNLPVLMCGMVGSTIGLQEVPYLECPVSPAQMAKRLAVIQQPNINGWIVPGLRCHSSFGELEMMRGEETQWLGWVNTTQPQASQHSMLCMPGTHSKWVTLSGAELTSFNTVVSGEVYALLSEHSILARGVQQFSEQAFLAGVERVAKGEPLTQVLFCCRSRVLAGQLSAQHSAAFLSGLVIGSDVIAQLSLLSVNPVTTISIIGAPRLTALYQTALTFHGLASNCYSGDEMSITGLHYLYQQKKIMELNNDHTIRAGT